MLRTEVFTLFILHSQVLSGLGSGVIVVKDEREGFSEIEQK